MIAPMQGTGPRESYARYSGAAFELCAATHTRSSLEMVSIRRLFHLDVPRLNVVMAYIGYMWFWTDADHDRAQAMVEETRTLLCELIVAASRTRPSAERLRLMSLRFLGGYVIGMRDVRYGHATVDRSVRFVVD